MHKTPQHHALRTLQRAAWRDSDVVEWEELPSLADSLRQRLTILGERHRAPADGGAIVATDWAETATADLEPLSPSEPFREVLSGLSMREVTEPDVFHHFFGATRGL